MPVQLGAKNHSLADPTALLSDCHRRIEGFLGALGSVALVIDQPLERDTRTALENALRYFREAAPKHTADEEESLFPRLRQLDDAEVKAAIAKLDALEQDHRRADCLHAVTETLGRRCLEQGCLSQPEAEQFRQAVASLASIYKEHIRIEDDVVFPVAGQTLSEKQKADIAGEMRDRRK